MIPLLFGFFKRLEGLDFIYRSIDLTILTYIVTTKISSIDTIKQQICKNAGKNLEFLKCHYVYFAGNVYLKKMKEEDFVKAFD